jgi:hypothetical protein
MLRSALPPGAAGSRWVAMGWVGGKAEHGSEGGAWEAREGGRVAVKLRARGQGRTPCQHGCPHRRLAPPAALPPPQLLRSALPHAALARPQQRLRGQVLRRLALLLAGAVRHVQPQQRVGGLRGAHLQGGGGRRLVLSEGPKPGGAEEGRGDEAAAPLRGGRTALYPCKPAFQPCARDGPSPQRLFPPAPLTSKGWQTVYFARSTRQSFIGPCIFDVPPPLTSGRTSQASSFEAMGRSSGSPLYVRAHSAAGGSSRRQPDQRPGRGWRESRHVRQLLRHTHAAFGLRLRQGEAMAAP